MKIGIEAQRIFRKNKHGMDYVALETIRQLQQTDKRNEYYIFVASGEDRCLDESENFRIVEIKKQPYPIWEQISLPRAIRRIKPQLLHCTGNTAPIDNKVPLILTLHDIIFLEKRRGGNKSVYQEMGWYYRKLIVPRILPACKRIITVSGYERDRICRALHLPEQMVTTIYNGYGPHFGIQPGQAGVTGKYIDSDDYILFLGNTDPKKNTPRVLKAYGIYLKASVHKRPLMIADLKETYIDSILKAENLEHIKPHLSYPGYIPNKDLAALYNDAFLFLYPSLRESFGIPMLEAMACGTPVIAGNTSAMPEIAGGAALLTDARDARNIAGKMLLLESSKRLYSEKAEAGLRRAALFSWEKTAEAVLEVYKEVYAATYNKDISSENPKPGVTIHRQDAHLQK